MVKYRFIFFNSIVLSLLSHQFSHMIIGLFSLIINLFIVIGLEKGKNWVRITYLVLVMLGLLIAVPGLLIGLKNADHIPPIGYYMLFDSFLHISINVTCVYLLLKKSSSDWFKMHKMKNLSHE